MADTTQLRRAVIERAVDGAGRAAVAQRRAAFANEGVAEPMRGLIDKVARNAYKVTDEDVAAVKAAGISDDEVFELAICAALGEATRQLDAALAALREAKASTAP